MQAHVGVRGAVLIAVAALLTCCAAVPNAPPTARSELAPTGKLRVGLLSGNPMYVDQKGPASELRGVAVDIGRDLATNLGVEFAPIRYTGVSGMLEGAKRSEWDVAFVAIDPTRAADWDYTAPYMEVDFTYLVPANSPIQTIDDADKPGRRLAAVQGAVGDLILSRDLKQASLIRVTSLTSAVELVAAGRADAVVSNRLTLLSLSANLPGSRVIEGRFYGAPIGVAVAKGRSAGAAYAQEFIEYAKASGLVQRAIDRADMQGVRVAPARSTK